MNSLYQTSALVNIEYQIDRATNGFVEKLSEFAKEGKTVDMSDWLKYCAFDAVGSLSVSHHYIKTSKTEVKTEY